MLLKRLSHDKVIKKLKQIKKTKKYLSDIKYLYNRQVGIVLYPHGHRRSQNRRLEVQG